MLKFDFGLATNLLFDLFKNQLPVYLILLYYSIFLFVT